MLCSHLVFHLLVIMKNEHARHIYLLLHANKTRQHGWSNVVQLIAQDCNVTLMSNTPFTSRKKNMFGQTADKEEGKRFARDEALSCQPTDTKRRPSLRGTNIGWERQHLTSPRDQESHIIVR